MIRAGFVAWLMIAILPGFGEVRAADSPEPAKKEAVSPRRVAELIRQLGDNDYFVRQRAEDELAQYGFEVFDAVSAAVNDDDPEIVARAKYLLKLMRIEWTAESDPPRVKALLHDYESVDASAREDRMDSLADLPNGQGTTALCRLVRFERLPLLSRKAALALLRSQAADEPPNAGQIKTIRKTLDTCKRPGAAWLLAWTRLGSEPDAAMAEWTRLVDDELGLLQQAQMETNAEIAAGLIRVKVLWLQKLGRADEALKAFRRLVEVTPGDSESLTELLEWLVKQKAWKAVDDLAQRFAPQLIGDAGLLYMLAEAYAEQGMKDRAEETATHALGLNPGKQEPQLLAHFNAAKYVIDHDRLAWAQRELEYVIAQSDPNDNDIAGVAQRLLAELLLKQKAWKALDDLAQRLPPQLKEHSTLLYVLAEAYAEQGLKDQAEETAERAFRLNPGKQEQELGSHVNAAKYLVDRGRFAWARREFDYVIAQGDLNVNNIPAIAQRMLAEMLHDQGHDIDAASALAKMLQAWENVKRIEGRPDDRELAEDRSRMHYFFACHWESKNDRAKQRASLDKALEVNPSDIETLIACYHLPEQTPEYHAKIVDLIHRAAAELDEKVTLGPNGTVACNQYAWLVGNSEGDLDRALKCSAKTVELSPNDSGLIDTLARVHFARGDLEEAVKLQTRAAELEPHSGLIQRQLDFFRKKLEEKKKP
jgi:tetratricopeptide (TPR) repeat protein